MASSMVFTDSKVPMSLPPLTLTTKLIVVLILGLTLSLVGNVLQLRSKWIGEGKALGDVERRQLTQENANYRQKAAINAAIALQAHADNRDILNRLDGIAARAQETRVIYRTVAAKAPLGTQCAPGQQRMDAVDAGLGPLSRGN